MKYWPLYIIFLILLNFSCRKKVAEDYQYYKPYKRTTVAVKDTITSSSTLDSVINSVVNEDKVPVDLNNKYFVVVASFSVEEYAIDMKFDLIKRGYKPEIFMLNNDGWNKLAIASFNNYEEATLAMNRIKQKGGLFSNARIVIK